MWSEGELNDFKYREIQKLAKENGIKANQPKAALISLIISKEEKEKGEEESKENDQSSSSSPTTTTRKLDETFDKEEILCDDETKGETRVIEGKQFTSFIAKNDSPRHPSKDSQHHQSQSEKKKKVNQEEEEEGKVNPVTTERPPSRFVEYVRNRQRNKEIVSKENIPSSSSSASSLKSSSLVGSQAHTRNNSVSRINTPRKTPRKSFSTKVSTPISSQKTVKSTSSPLVAKKDPIRALDKDSKQIGKSSSLNSKIPTTKQKIKKIPDFAKLHAQQFSKMDSLTTYLHKKEDRKKAILTPGSSLKPSSSNPPVRVSPRTLGASHKKLNSTITKTSFAPNNLSVNKSNFNFGKDGSSLSAKKVNGVFKFNPASPIKKGTSTPASNRKILLNNSNQKILHNVTNNTTMNSSIGGFSAKKTLKYKPYTGKVQSWDEKMKERKVGLKNMTKSTGNNKAPIIKGVRMNKRAELLMKRRQITDK